MYYVTMTKIRAKVMWHGRFYSSFFYRRNSAHTEQIFKARYVDRVTAYANHINIKKLSDQK